MIWLLMDGMRQCLERALSGRNMPRGEDGRPFGEPRVFVGAVPPKESARGGKADPFPFVVLRWTGSEDGREEWTEEIALILGVWGVEIEQHEHYVTNLAWAVRKTLAGQRTIGRWELDLPMRSRQPPHEQQPHPYSAAYVNSRWRARAPEAPLEGFDDMQPSEEMP